MMEELKLIAWVAGIVFGPKAMTALLGEIRLLYLTVFLTLGSNDPQRLAMGVSLLGVRWNESQSESLADSSSTALVKHAPLRGANGKSKK